MNGNAAASGVVVVVMTVIPVLAESDTVCDVRVIFSWTTTMRVRPMHL